MMFNVFYLQLLTLHIAPETLMLNYFAHFCIALLRRVKYCNLQGTLYGSQIC
jgi:hypothetical protein